MLFYSPIQIIYLKKKFNQKSNNKYAQITLINIFSFIYIVIKYYLSNNNSYILNYCTMYENLIL